jgi:small subunit ribosomal protein S27Ae
MADEKKPKPKAAPAKGNGKKIQKKYEKYEISGDTIKRKNKSCPKCGPGVFMASHKDRWACGRCGYMEKK